MRTRTVAYWPICGQYSDFIPFKRLENQRFSVLQGVWNGKISMIQLNQISKSLSGTNVRFMIFNYSFNLLIQKSYKRIIEIVAIKLSAVLAGFFINLVELAIKYHFHNHTQIFVTNKKSESLLLLVVPFYKVILTLISRTVYTDLKRWKSDFLTKLI